MSLSIARTLTTHEPRAFALTRGIEQERPFVGERIWRLYGIYSTFALRTVIKLSEGRTNGKIYEWNKDMHGREDNATLQMLDGVLTTEEMKIVRADRNMTPLRIMVVT